MDVWRETDTCAPAAGMVRLAGLLSMSPPHYYVGGRRTRTRHEGATRLCNAQGRATVLRAQRPAKVMRAAVEVLQWRILHSETPLDDAEKQLLTECLSTATMVQMPIA